MASYHRSFHIYFPDRLKQDLFESTLCQRRTRRALSWVDMAGNIFVDIEKNGEI